MVTALPRRLAAVTIISGALSRSFIIVIFLGADTKSGRTHPVQYTHTQHAIWLLRAQLCVNILRCDNKMRHAPGDSEKTDICGQPPHFVLLSQTSLIIIRLASAHKVGVIILFGRFLCNWHAADASISAFNCKSAF